MSTLLPQSSMTGGTAERIARAVVKGLKGYWTNR